LSSTLILNHVRKSFSTQDGPIHVLEDLTFSLNPGELLAVTGESGSGKSTLLHIVGALETSDSGEIRYGDCELSNLSENQRAQFRRSMVGIIFQQYNLVPSLDVLANIRLHARLAGRENRDWTRYLLDRLGLGSLAGRYPEQLSGGQQQRVAIGRTLAAKPGLILADEPTGNLDERSSATVFELMSDLTEESGASLIVVTHSNELAGRIGRKLHLHGGRVA
jgi:putative ABC transport system ATP-binding protein